MAERVAESVAEHRVSREVGSQSFYDKSSGSIRKFGGAPEEIRTPNLLIRSQMLYPLSYGRLVTDEV